MISLFGQLLCAREGRLLHTAVLGISVDSYPSGLTLLFWMGICRIAASYERVYDIWINDMCYLYSGVRLLAPGSL